MTQRAPIDLEEGISFEPAPPSTGFCPRSEAESRRRAGYPSFRMPPRARAR